MRLQPFEAPPAVQLVHALSAGLATVCIAHSRPGLASWEGFDPYLALSNCRSQFHCHDVLRRSLA